MSPHHRPLRTFFLPLALALLVGAQALAPADALIVDGSPVEETLRALEAATPIDARRQCPAPRIAVAELAGTPVAADAGIIEDAILPDFESRSAQRYILDFNDLQDFRVGDDYSGGTVVHVDDVLHFISVQVDATTESTFRASVARDARVRYCELDGTYRALFTPNDPRWTDAGHYGMQHVKAHLAWDTTLGTTAKTVCVIDTGVDYTHPDIAGPRWLGGYDFVNNDNDPMDDHGHGTHVAGTIGATTNNAVGVAGAAQVGLNAAKVLSASGSGQWSWIASGITWCANNADVLSLSLGGGSGSATVQSALQYAYNTMGRLVLAAAGNSGPCFNCVSYPAKYDEAIAVSCSDAAKLQCGFSSDGPEIELAGPGAGILSTCTATLPLCTSFCSQVVPDYSLCSGTSMSTPHVSGVAALVWSHVPALTAAQLRVILKCTAQPLGPPGWDEFFGHGLVDAEDALDKAIAGGCPPFAPSELPCGAVFTLDGVPISGSYSGPTVLKAIHATSADHVAGYSYSWTSSGTSVGTPGLTVLPLTHDDWQVTGDNTYTYQITFAVSLPCGGPFLVSWTQVN